MGRLNPGPALVILIGCGGNPRDFGRTIDLFFVCQHILTIDLKMENSVGANLNQTPGIHVLRVETI